MKIIKKIKANSVQILEVLMLITVIFLPYILDIPSWFEDYLRDHKPEPEISNFLPYYILKAGNVAISLGLLFAVLIVIRRYNKEFVMNNDNVYEIINLGSNNPISLKDMINTIGEVLGVTPSINTLPMQPGDVDRTYADISKAKKLLGYEPKTSFKEGIENFINWYKNNSQE